ncbi:MAG TPA: ATP-binding cassette domain-containing protein [Capsulimonadaceae bacterium]|jgi:iron complex transport system ATP-binding protein
MLDLDLSAPLLSITHATVARDGNRVLDDVSLEIQLGRNTAVIGPNGCGKSSLIKLLTRQYYPLARLDDQPTVRILGKDRWNVEQLRSHLGIVSTDMHQFFLDDGGDLTGAEIALSGFFSSRGLAQHHVVTDALRTKALEALDRMGVAHLADRAIGRMSTGEGRRVVIARALVSEPMALVLDEPTTGLDMVAQHRFLARIRKLAAGGTTIVIVTHHIDEVIPEIEHVVLLKSGRVFADGPKADVLTAANLTLQYNTPITLRRAGDFYVANVERDS